MDVIEIVKTLLDVLPDSRHDDANCWIWCWNELDGDAQEQVKQARALGQNYLDGVREK